MPTEFFLSPRAAQRHLGLKEPDPRLKLGVSVFDKRTGQSEIIVNSQLSPALQQVVLEQERTLSRIVNSFTGNHPEFHLEDILPQAHYEGLMTAVSLAKQLGVLNQYLEIRGMGETEESIMSSPRP